MQVASRAGRKICLRCKQTVMLLPFNTLGAAGCRPRVARASGRWARTRARWQRRAWRACACRMRCGPGRCRRHEAGRCAGGLAGAGAAWRARHRCGGLHGLACRRPRADVACNTCAGLPGAEQKPWCQLHVHSGTSGLWREAAVRMQASTQGLARALAAAGAARALCPVPDVCGGLGEPPVVPRFLAALQARARRPGPASPGRCEASRVRRRRLELAGALRICPGVPARVQACTEVLRSQHSVAMWLSAQGSRVQRGGGDWGSASQRRGGLTPAPVPQAAGVSATRVPCYTTEPGTTAEQAGPELALLRDGHICAVALTSSAEVRPRLRGRSRVPSGRRGPAGSV